MKAIDNIADNAILKIVGRIGMMLAVPAFGLFAAFLGNQSEAIANASRKVDAVASDTSEQIAKISGRVDLIDQRINIGQKQREDFQNQMLNFAAETQKQQSTILQQQASIIATLTALSKQVDGLDKP